MQTVFFSCPQNISRGSNVKRFLPAASLFTTVHIFCDFLDTLGLVFTKLC